MQKKKKTKLWVEKIILMMKFSDLQHISESVLIKGHLSSINAPVGVHNTNSLFLSSGEGVNEVI